MNLKLISASAASEKPVDAFRYPTANPDNLLRNINLISNPAFEPALLDTSSFNININNILSLPMKSSVLVETDEDKKSLSNRIIELSRTTLKFKKFLITLAML